METSKNIAKSRKTTIRYYPKFNIMSIFYMKKECNIDAQVMIPPQLQ